MNKLKQLRKEANLSLRQLQEFIGVDFSRLGKLEKSDLNMESHTLEKILSFFMIDYHYFKSGDGLIYFYDAKRKHFFPLSSAQFNSLLENNLYSVEIIDCKVRRILTDNGFKQIDKIFNHQEIVLKKKIRFYQLVDELSEYENCFLEDLKEEIDGILSKRLPK